MLACPRHLIPCSGSYKDTSLLEHLLLICMQERVLSDYHWLLQENAGKNL